jgi:hypothetical protein
VRFLSVFIGGNPGELCLQKILLSVFAVSEWRGKIIFGRIAVGLLGRNEER